MRGARNLGHIWWCLGLISDSVLRNHYRWDMEELHTVTGLEPRPAIYKTSILLASPALRLQWLRHLPCMEPTKIQSQILHMHNLHLQDIASAELLQE